MPLQSVRSRANMTFGVALRITPISRMPLSELRSPVCCRSGACLKSRVSLCRFSRFAICSRRHRQTLRW